MNLKSKYKTKPPTRTIDRYSVEYFHIYTDEKINNTHKTSLNYLKSAQTAWDFSPDPIILIDNYNPKTHTLSTEEILDFLKLNGMPPKYWAFEGDFIANAKILLEHLTSKKLTKNYEQYIKSHDKYPCSLLTATWYLTRLGKLDSSMIQSHDGNKYIPAARLVNILPKDYRSVELRAQDLILHSEFKESAHQIQDLFFSASAHRKLDLF